MHLSRIVEMKQELIHADCLEWMKAQPDNIVRLTFTSPPYEDARTYGVGFKLRGQGWVDWMIPRIVEMCRVTDGLVFINAAGKVREHAAKARAIRLLQGPNRPPLPCRQCGVPVQQPVMGLKKYCSTKCRSLHYQVIGRAELRCDHCGHFFMGFRAQVLRAKRGQKVCCSLDCRNSMNIVACLTARGAGIPAEDC